MCLRVVGAVAATLLLLSAAPGSAQSKHRELTKPPDYDGENGKAPIPGAQAVPSEEEKSLLERAQRMHNQAYGLRAKAEDLRDDFQYEDAEELDDRADEFDSRATDLERRAERERMGVKGPFKPVQ